MKNTFAGFILLVGTIIFGCKKEDSISFEEQLAIDIALIDDYLNENNIQAEVHETGIRYVVSEEGDGESPTSSSRVIAKYEGSFLSDEIFDSNQLGINFGLNEVIVAWREIIPEMKEGEKITIYAPSGYCYGKAGRPGIPTNSVLIFEIELVSIVKSESDQRTIDLDKIDEYLSNNNIDYQIHSSGIRYQIIEEGAGINPIASDNISVKYIGKFLDDVIFEDQSSTSVTLTLNNTIVAWKTMLPTIKEGGRLIFYAPSGLCYGNVGDYESIPPNANLIFDIELVAINP